jgi:hypothetical protein
MYEELWSFRTSRYHILPSWRGYTLLVPTLAEIQQLTTNLEMGATTEAKTLFTLLLHIIPERLFTADLLAFARPSVFLHARLRRTKIPSLFDVQDAGRMRSDFNFATLPFDG